MVNVRLTGVSVENSKKSIIDRIFGKKHDRWWASVALHLQDTDTHEDVSEWFYLIVCSEEYMKRPFKKGPALDEKYLIIQQHLNLDAVKESARERLNRIEAKDWEEFYKTMELSFLHDS
ncbi:MAG: Imm8 family immunity protein [Candidatus Saccharibacteria bacterium]